jgi:hypothetical protein
MERLAVHRFKYFDAKKRRYVQTQQLATREAIARMGWRELPESTVLVPAELVDESGLVTTNARAEAFAEAAN